MKTAPKNPVTAYKINVVITNTKVCLFSNEIIMLSIVEITNANK